MSKKETENDRFARMKKLGRESAAEKQKHNFSLEENTTRQNKKLKNSKSRKTADIDEMDGIEIDSF